jgi:hypothetical protein
MHGRDKEDATFYKLLVDGSKELAAWAMGSGAAEERPHSV